MMDGQAQNGTRVLGGWWMVDGWPEPRRRGWSGHEVDWLGESGGPRELINAKTWTCERTAPYSTLGRCKNGNFFTHCQVGFAPTLNWLGCTWLVGRRKENKKGGLCSPGTHWVDGGFNQVKSQARRGYECWYMSSVLDNRRIRDKGCFGWSQPQPVTK